MSQTLTVNVHRAQRAAIEILAAFGILLGAIALGHCGSSCKAFQGRTPTPPTVNEVEYSSQLASCVERANTVKESRECRDAVSRSWGLCTKVDGVERCP